MPKSTDRSEIEKNCAKQYVVEEHELAKTRCLHKSIIIFVLSQNQSITREFSNRVSSSLKYDSVNITTVTLSGLFPKPLFMELCVLILCYSENL